MEHYCTSCGKWSCLIAFWLCRNCFDRFYDR
jgi:ribosomal protein S14